MSGRFSRCRRSVRGETGWRSCFFEALGEDVCSASVILNSLARTKDPTPAATILTPDALRLRCARVADCSRYDSLRSAR